MRRNYLRSSAIPQTYNPLFRSRRWSRAEKSDESQFAKNVRFDSTETSLRPVARPALRPGSTLRKKESFSTFSRQRLTCCCDRVRNVPFLPRVLRRVGQRQRKAPAILSRSITIDPEVLQMNGHCFLFYHRFNTLI